MSSFDDLRANRRYFSLDLYICVAMRNVNFLLNCHKYAQSVTAIFNSLFSAGERFSRQHYVQVKGPFFNMYRILFTRSQQAHLLKVSSSNVC